MKRLAVALAAVVFLYPAFAYGQPTAPAERRYDRKFRCPMWIETARRVGWPEHALPTLDRVMWRESRCRTDVENLYDPWGGSVGLLQVNRGWVRWLREGGVIDHSSDLFSGQRNLAAGLAIYRYACDRHGECWIAWGMRTA